MSSAAFSASKSDGGMSGELSCILAEDGLQDTLLCSEKKNFIGAASIKIADLLLLALSVEHKKVPANYYHGNVLGISSGLRRKIKAKATMVIDIDQDAAAAFFAERDRKARELDSDINSVIS